MKYLLIFLALIALWHFVYEGILAPSLRLVLRCKLFQLRDELRALHADGLDSNDEKAFWFVHDGINKFLNRLPNMTIYRVGEVDRAFHKDPNLPKLLEAQLRLVREATEGRINEVFRKVNRVLMLALMFNAGGWVVYLLPIVVARSLTAKASKLARELLGTPANTLERYMPQQN